MNRKNTMLRQGELIRQTVFVISLGCILSACGSASKAAPKAQQTGFLQQVRNSSITIYPAVVVRETGISELDTTSASEFGDFIEAEVAKQIDTTIDAIQLQVQAGTVGATAGIVTSLRYNLGYRQ